MRRAKLESWRRFVTSHGNSEPWSIAYKLQAEKLRARDLISILRSNREQSTTDARETASLLTEVYVSDDLKDLETPEQRTAREGACSSYQRLATLYRTKSGCKDPQKRLSTLF